MPSSSPSNFISTPCGVPGLASLESGWWIPLLWRHLTVAQLDRCGVWKFYNAISSPLKPYFFWTKSLKFHEISLYWHTVTVLSIPILTRLWCLRKTPKCQEAHAEAQQEDLVAKAQCRRVMLATAMLIIFLTFHHSSYYVMTYLCIICIKTSKRNSWAECRKGQSSHAQLWQSFVSSSHEQNLTTQLPTPFSSFFQLQILTWPLGQSKTASKRGVSDSTETTVTPFTFKASKTFWSSEALGW